MACVLGSNFGSAVFWRTHGWPGLRALAAFIIVRVLRARSLWPIGCALASPRLQTILVDPSTLSGVAGVVPLAPALGGHGMRTSSCRLVIPRSA